MISEQRRVEISQAVQNVYQDAGLNLKHLKSSIVPLYELIKSYPISIFEVQDMTPQKIIEFFETERGQVLFIPESEDRNLAGYLYLEKYQETLYGCILVEKKPKLAPIFRRRFSAAHELGHYILHFLPLFEKPQFKHSAEPFILAEGLYQKDEADEKEKEERETEQELISNFSLTNDLQAVEYLLGIDRYQMEEEADLFAAELLMPTSICYTLAQRYQGRFGKKREVLAGRLASELMVSKQAMKRRLNELQLPENLAENAI